MVAFEQYTVAVAIRSARFLCILLGVAIGTTFMLILSSDRVASLWGRLHKRGGR